MTACVPFLDLQRVNDRHRSAYHAALDRLLDSGRFVLGSETQAFELEFARRCGAPHCVGVSSGLEALHLCLRAWDIGPGDEVIVPSHTFIATWLAVSQVGATPVPVEPDAASFNIDPARVAAAINPRTRAIIAVHLYGRPAAMDALRRVARQHGLLLLEDAAQAHGAAVGGGPVGMLGDAAAFSFYPGKNLGAIGDAGAITCRDAALAGRLRLLRNYGSQVKYEHAVPGFNARLDELQAAILRERLRFLDADNAWRTRLADRYREQLCDIAGLHLPGVGIDETCVWHLFVVRHARRDRLARRLRELGVETVIHYPVAIHHQPAYSGRDWPRLPLAERFAAEVLSLPIGPTLSLEDQDRVIGAVRIACGELVAGVGTAAA